MRCFVAVELSDAGRRVLLKLLRGLPREREVRWCSEPQLHVTLKFLGDVRDGDLSAVCGALAAASAEVAPITLRLDGLGVFPNVHSPRVFWVGVDDPARACARWVSIADPLLAELGFAAETRVFTPHITLGRSKGPGGNRALARMLDETAAPEAVEMTAEEVVLFESHLSPQGARYSRVATFALGGVT